MAALIGKKLNNTTTKPITSLDNLLTTINLTSHFVNYLSPHEVRLYIGHRHQGWR